MILQAYQRELCRTVAYVAEQMEARGGRVDWDYLYTGLIADEHHPKMFISTLSECGPLFSLITHVFFKIGVFLGKRFIEDNLLQS